MYPPRSPKSAAPAPASASCPEPPIGSAVPTSSASIPVTSSVVDPGVGSISPASPKISLAPTDGKSQMVQGCGPCEVWFWERRPSGVRLSVSCSVKELVAKDPGRTLESQELSRIPGKGKDWVFFVPKYNAPLIRAFQLEVVGIQKQCLFKTKQKQSIRPWVLLLFFRFLYCGLLALCSHL